MKNIAWMIPGLALVSVIGCSDKGDDSGSPTGDGGAGDGGTGSCEVEVDASFPVDGTPDAYYRTTIEFELSDPDPEGTPTVTVVDGSGATVAGTTTLNEDGDVVIFTPDAPLSAATTFTATLDWCAGTYPITFTTSSLGGSLTSDLVGKSYVVDLTAADFVEPAGVADLLLGSLENSILLGVQATSPNLQMIGAISVDAGTDQDLCTETIPFPAADFSQSPYFEVGPEDTTISVAGYNIEILQLEVTGTFAADGSYFGGGTLSGELDARLLAPLVGELLGTKDPDEICGVVAGFGVSCEVCSSDGQPYCLAVYVRDITANELGATIVERSTADIAGDPSCAE